MIFKVFCCYCTCDPTEFNRPVFPQLVVKQPKRDGNTQETSSQEGAYVVDPVKFAEESLREHNKYRKMHGVPPLVHSQRLCDWATSWANFMGQNDVYEHRPNNKYGENLHQGHRMTAEKAVREFYEEIFLYDYENPKFEKATGHFTQVVWRDSKELGTGICQVGGIIYVCCNYNPPGNYQNEFGLKQVPRVFRKCDNNLNKSETD